MEKQTQLLVISNLLMLLLASGLRAQQGEDSGYFLMGPETETYSKEFKDGKRLVHYTHDGMVIGEQPGSPWQDASFLVQGSFLLDESGRRIADVALCETTDPDGDLTWFVFRTSEKGYEFYLKAGTGKWKNITGIAVYTGNEVERADDYYKFPWKLEWKILDEDEIPGLPDPDVFKFHDTGLSFHGPHIQSREKELKNGVKLIYSDQKGVLLSDNPDAVSPRNFATCFDRGTTYLLDGKNLGDVMILEDTDPDGDIVWLYHEWWYGQGPGSYEFIAGTGKWEGISGRGITRGMLKARTDDHFMLKSEIHWNLQGK